MEHLTQLREAEGSRIQDEGGKVAVFVGRDFRNECWAGHFGLDAREEVPARHVGRIAHRNDD